MAVFEMGPGNGFQYLYVSREDRSVARQICEMHWEEEPSKPLLASLEIVDFDVGRRLSPTNIYVNSVHGPVFDERSSAEPGDLLVDQSKLIPLLRHPNKALSLYCADVVDALDWEASSVKRFKSGRLMSLITAVLRKDIVKDMHIFMIPETYLAFVSEDFRARVMSAGLQGVSFRECSFT